MGEANEKQHLCSSQQPLSFESLIEDVDELSRRRGYNLLEGRTNQVSTRLASLALGS